MIASALLTVFLAAWPVQQQGATGSWIGTLQTPAGKLRLVIHIEKTAGGFAGKLDSPDQSAFGIAIDEVEVEAGTVRFAIKRLRVSFKGKLDAKAGTIAGTFSQDGDQPLTLKRMTKKLERKRRPQEPKPPLPYRAVDVSYDSGPDVQLAGTLTLPKGNGPFAAVVLVSGSGPQDRDESLRGHRPFLVLADALTRRGIAVLRYDDRGFGKSTGKFAKATTEDFASDALAGVAFLRTRKDIDAKKIGICGHSEGGLIAPICAVKSKDVAFIVLLAGPAVSGADILKVQSRRLLEAAGAPKPVIEAATGFNGEIYAVLGTDMPLSETRTKLRDVLERAWKANPQGTMGDFVKAQSKRLLSPWFRHFVRFDPGPTIAKVTCPMLVLNGEKDVQVDANQNLPVFRKLLAKHKDATIVELERLNHLFQTCKTGALSEYGQIEETMSPKLLKRVGDWIVERFVK